MATLLLDIVAGRSVDLLPANVSSCCEKSPQAGIDYTVGILAHGSSPVKSKVEAFRMTAETTLGLDLGSNSIGWALVDEKNGRIVATGVRVFPEGVDRDQKGGEVSKNEARRIARGMRRQIARRARRKRLLRSELVKVGLLPSDVDAQHALFQIDPYGLRAKALRERLEPHEFGRVLVHLNQRRGFLSNRKTDRAKDKELKGMLAEISTLASEIPAAGCATLGEFFAQLRAGDPLQRVRGKHTRRDMFECEFATIWKVQRKHHPDLLSDDLCQRLHRIIFFQRKMYWPKSVVGMCELEPKRRRCRRADLAAQRFRLLQEVNNLKLLDPTIGAERKLTEEERSKLIGYLSAAKERTFDQIRKHLGLLESCKFNLERGNRTKLLGMPTDALLAHKDVFGSTWYKRPFAERDAIVRILLNDELGDVELKRLATEQWGLDDAEAEQLLGIELPPGYVNLSRDAIEKLLPHVERGLLLMTDDNAPCALVEAGYLRPDQRAVRTVDQLAPPPNLPNPIVRQALHEVRKVVNAIIREYGKPARIHVELAREVKGSLEQRAEHSRQIREREAQRKHIAQKIADGGFAPNAESVSRATINRYLLWEEQSQLCIYTGRSISMAQLLGGEVDIDHILPRHRSLDDSMANKVVCFRSANQDKDDQTPYEWLAKTHPEQYDQVCQRAAKIPYNKRRKFIQKEVVLDDFIARQLVDTAYISRAVLQYLRPLGADMLGLKGQLTADLRWQWGLDTVLRHDDLQIKNRDDHRHHAVDAIVVALTNGCRLHQLAGVRRRGGTRTTGEVLRDPWTTFRQDVEAAVNAINVSHRPRRRVKGSLHDDKPFGPTADPEVFVKRKPIAELSPSEIAKIRDDSIRSLVEQRLASVGIEVGRGKKVNAKLMQETLSDLKMPSGVPIKKVRLLVQSKTVQRIREGTPHEVFVNPMSTHHLEFFEWTVQGITQRNVMAVTMLDAKKRLKANQPIISRTAPVDHHSISGDAKFLFSLSKGEAVFANVKGSHYLLVFNTAAQTTGQMWFHLHSDAKRLSDRQSYSFRPSTLNARKVVIDPLGRLRWAND